MQKVDFGFLKIKRLEIKIMTNCRNIDYRGWTQNWLKLVSAAETFSLSACLVQSRDDKRWWSLRLYAKIYILHTHDHCQKTAVVTMLNQMSKLRSKEKCHNDCTKCIMSMWVSSRSSGYTLLNYNSIRTKGGRENLRRVSIMDIAALFHIFYLYNKQTRNMFQVTFTGFGHVFH